MCIPSGELLLFALGTGEYNELACEQPRAAADMRRCRACPLHALVITSPCWHSELHSTLLLKG